MPVAMHLHKLFHFWCSEIPPVKNSIFLEESLFPEKAPGWAVDQ